MATVAASNPRATQAAVKQPPSASRSVTTGADPYHGHERMAKLSGRFVAHLFACPDQASGAAGQPAPARLDHFIAYALHRTRLPESVNFAALFLLQRLKARFPAAKGSSGHRLFISAFMLASKIICDDTYSNKSWCIVAQGMFALREINQMEREMCSYLEWQLNVEPTVLDEFTRRVSSDFSGPGPYPALILPSEAESASSSLHSFGQSGSARIYAPASPADSPVRGDVSMSSSPSTPGASSSVSVSPASIAAPRTPTDAVPGYHVEVAGAEPEVRRSSRGHAKAEPERERPIAANVDPYRAVETMGEHADAIVGVPGSKKRVVSPTMRSKLQVGRDMYAYATRTIW
jgi:hypothetical protein